MIILLCLCGTVKAGSWNQVDLRGMGYVTGIVAHPTAANLIYARTDVAGIFKWQAATQSWTALMDNPLYADYCSVESFAIDRNNPTRIFAAYGDNLDGTGASGIIRSDDGGTTWTLTNFPGTARGGNVAMGGNQQWRWDGERLAVDPLNSNYVYFGSRQNGLWRSTNGGIDWTAYPSTTVPFGDNGNSTSGGISMNGGVTFVAIDGRVAVAGGTNSATLYVGVMGAGIWQSIDGGATFAKISNGTNQPPDTINPSRGVVAADGTFYVNFEADYGATGGGIWRYRGGAWSNITVPTTQSWNNRNWSGLAVDPNNSNHIVVTSQGCTPYDYFVSTTGGDTWVNVGSDAAYQRLLKCNAPAWYPTSYKYNLAGGAIFDPTHPGWVWITSGFGVFLTQNVDAAAPVLDAYNYMKGLEEMVVTQIKALPAGASNAFLCTAMDMTGFVFQSPTQIPSARVGSLGIANGTGITSCYSQPDNMAMVGGKEDYSAGMAMVTSNGGTTWTDLPKPAAKTMAGNIAMSSTNPKIMVWVPLNPSWYDAGNDLPVYTTNGGVNWHVITTLPSNTNPLSQVYFNSQVLAADTVKGNVFYYFEEAYTYAKIRRSDDGGATWNVVNSTSITGSWRVKVEAAPGYAGEVWVGTMGGSLSYSTDYGVHFNKITSLDAFNNFAVGPALSGGSAPTLWVAGKYQGTLGIFYSTDRGATWTNANLGGTIPFDAVNTLAADYKTAGRIYLGMNGRGMFWGDVAVGAQPVLTPTSTPLPGTYSAAQSISLACTTSGASIIYTTDGSTPTENNGTVTHGVIYTGTAIPIPSTTTLKAMAFKSGLKDSGVFSGVYTIQTPKGRK